MKLPKKLAELRDNRLEELSQNIKHSTNWEWRDVIASRRHGWDQCYEALEPLVEALKYYEQGCPVIGFDRGEIARESLDAVLGPDWRQE